MGDKDWSESLNLPWSYAVLGYAAHPEDESRQFALLKLHKKPDWEYAVYRVDPRDGSCHGGRYPGQDGRRAYEIFGEYVAQVGAAL